MLRSGAPFSFTDPKPSDVNIEDIAYALSNICRFGGHTHDFYSVAEHSIHCSYRVPQGQEMVALLHDATEAYVGDVVAPLKSLLPEYKKVEARVWEAICERFGLETELGPDVHKADTDMLMLEARDLLLPLGVPKFDFVGHPMPEAMVLGKGDVLTMNPEEARYVFLDRYQELGGSLS